MNTSQFMDKQILGLAASASPSGGGAGGGGSVDLSDLMIPSPQEDGEDRLRRRRSVSSANGIADDVLPSYDFQPIRTTAAATAPQASWGSLDSKAPSASYNLKSAGILEPHVLKKVSHEEDRSNIATVTITDIDRTMKKYSDNLLHALEGVSSRLSQMESRTHHLETSVDDSKLTIGNYNGSTDGKLRHLENMLREVQAGVQILRDKQEIVETQLQLAKFQTPKTDTQSSENSGSGQAGSQQQPAAPPQVAMQPQHQVLTPSQPPALPALPAPNAPPPPPTLQSQPPSQFPSHLQHSQLPSVPTVASVPSVPALPRDAYYAPSAQPTETMHQQYQAPPVPQPQAPPATPQQYQTPSQFPQYSQPPQASKRQPFNSPCTPAPQQPEETMPHAPTQNYPPNARAPSPYMQQPSGPAPPYYAQQNPSMYEPPASRPNPGSSYGSGGYGPQGGGGFSESYGYTGSPSHRGNAGMKPSSPFAPSSGGSGNYGSGRLPTAQILPQAVPISSSSPSGSSGNRVPLDDVVEKVATMGFSREQVRATVRRLTENGQNVDLNVVLDRLMNGR
ncbi:class E vacuolar protein-sorting machinery protein HSE1-like [Panicum miliaceum]|uniref:Class E vacuolar protein-sorting machinery protein HSE1-like n=1 Tax=Panicum miliaceum TaxID=4540 RepID=A0A3L6SQ48_PANMI|nr:class E vacuolar protein-sorting machinery protein HSE1-like [Panicum miliaceum]